MRTSVLRLVAIAASASLMFGSTAAVAAVSPAPAASQFNPWQALSMLNGGASTIAYCGAAAAAQVGQVGTNCVLPQVDAPPPQSQPQPAMIDEPLPPPLPGAAEPFAINPLLIALGVIAVGALAYLLLNGGGNNSNSPG